MEPEYYCVYCEDYVLSIDTIMWCPRCKEYKGLVKITAEEE